MCFVWYGSDKRHCNLLTLDKLNVHLDYIQASIGTRSELQ